MAVMNTAYNWSEAIDQVLQKGFCRSSFFEMLLLWGTGDDKYRDIRRRYFQIFLDFIFVN